MDNKLYFDTVETAAILGVSKWTVIRWCSCGRFTGAFLPKRSRRLGWHIPRDEVYALLEKEELDAREISLSR